MGDTKRTQSIASLTGIRGIACLAIVCYHYFCLFVDDRGLGADALPLAPYSEFFFTYSKNAVELFFMISGFLIALHYRDRIASMSAWDYFKGRYKKLIVASVVVNLWALGNAFAMLATVPGSEGTVSPITPVRVVLSVLMLNTGWFTSYKQTMLPINSTMWFVDVLLLCYVVYFLVRKLAANAKAYVALCVGMVALGWICLEHTPNLPFLWTYDGRGYAPFFLGALLCEVQTRASERVRRNVSAVWVALIVCLAAARAVIGFEGMFGEMGSPAYVRYFEFFVAPGLLLAALNLRPVRGFLELKPLLWLGVLSGALYYVHNCVMEDVLVVNYLTGNHVDFSSVWVLLLMLVGVIPFAILWQRAEQAIRRRTKRPAAA